MPSNPGRVPALATARRWPPAPPRTLPDARNSLRAAAVAAALAATLPAQRLFDPLPRRSLPELTHPPTSIAVGDVDGDGVRDVVLGVANNQNRLWLGNGDGTFRDASAMQMPPDGENTRSVALGDVDGDGDLDLVVGNAPPGYLGYGGQNRLYRNNGHGTFTDDSAVSLPPNPDATAAVVLGDVDGDGDLDLLCVGGNEHLLRNDGTGRFTDVTATHLPNDNAPTYAASFTDVDGDGDRDLALANFGQDRLYLNNGAGVFTDATATHLPVHPNFTRFVTAVDVDGDGDFDLVAGEYGAQRLWRNNGNGTFVDASNNLPPLAAVVQDIAATDLEGDGDLDLVLACAGETRCWRNNGAGVFTDVTATHLPADADGASGVALTDLDNDGDRDVLFVGGRRVQLLLGDTAGPFAAVDVRRLASQDSLAVAAADVDGDGDRDLLLGTSGPCALWRNDGLGRFTDDTAACMPAVATPAIAIAAGDVDGDGDLDIVLANAGYAGQNHLFLNNGSGTFTDATATHLPVANDTTKGVAVGDVDGDGDLDLVFANQGQSRLLVNSGAGVFTDVTATQLPQLTDTTRGLALADLDGDGDRDILLANHGQDHLLLNNGIGSFVDATTNHLPVDSDFSTCVAAGDIDGDGDLDLLFGDLGGFWYGWSRGLKLYRNVGNATFQDDSAALPMDVQATASLALGDVDGDGDLDLVTAKTGYCFFGSCQSAPPRLHLNQGAGVFVDATDPALPDGGLFATGSCLADLDGDDDLDLVIGNNQLNWWQTPLDDVVWFGLRRQLHAPVPLRLGRPATLEIHCQSAVPAQPTLILPWLSLTRASLPLPPFGMLGIQPQVGLPVAVLPLGTGVTTVTWPVPNAQSLAGVPVHAQALLLELSLQAHVTNVVTDVVLR